MSEFVVFDTDDKKLLDELDSFSIDKGTYKYKPIFFKKDSIEYIIGTLDKGAVVSLISGETYRVANKFEDIYEQLNDR